MTFRIIVVEIDDDVYMTGDDPDPVLGKTTTYQSLYSERPLLLAVENITELAEIRTITSSIERLGYDVNMLTAEGMKMLTVDDHGNKEEN